MRLKKFFCEIADGRLVISGPLSVVERMCLSGQGVTKSSSGLRIYPTYSDFGPFSGKESATVSLELICERVKLSYHELPHEELYILLKYEKTATGNGNIMTWYVRTRSEINCYITDPKNGISSVVDAHQVNTGRGYNLMHLEVLCKQLGLSHDMFGISVSGETKTFYPSMFRGDTEDDDNITFIPLSDIIHLARKMHPGALSNACVVGVDIMEDESLGLHVEILN